MQSDVNARITALEAQISDLNQQIARAPKAKRQQLMAQKESAQGELDLRKAMQQTFEQMAQFISTNGEAAKAACEGSINELRRSVPELVEHGAGKTDAKPPSDAGVDARLQRRLDWRSGGLYDQLQGMHQISQMMQETAQVRDAANRLRSPLVGHAARHHSARAATGSQPSRQRRPANRRGAAGISNGSNSMC